jgi:hypothetical protein
MSSKREHDAYGMAAGALTAVLHTALTGQRPTLLDVIAAGVGGGIGGLVGSRVPDVIEPATSSWHRSTAHSVAATGAVAYAGVAHVAPLAARLHGAADAAPDPLSRALARVGPLSVAGLFHSWKRGLRLFGVKSSHQPLFVISLFGLLSRCGYFNMLAAFAI